MTEMISMAIWLHVGAILLILAVILWILRVLKSDKAFVPLSIKYETVSLYYRALLGTLFFTGIVVMAVAMFAVSWMVYVMVLMVLIMIGTSIKESRLYKQTHIKNIPAQERFKTYAVKKYFADIIMILTTTVLAYAVSL